MAKVPLLQLSRFALGSRLSLYFSIASIAIAFAALFTWVFLHIQGTDLIWLSGMWVIATVFATIGAVNNLLFTLLDMNKIVIVSDNNLD